MEYRSRGRRVYWFSSGPGVFQLSRRMDFDMGPAMIGVMEQTYSRHDHAPVNAVLIHATSLALPAEDILFASTGEHRGHVRAVRSLPHRVQCVDIAVPPPGGIRFSRFVAQWRAMRLLMRQGRPRAVILLSSGPETFFAARAMVAMFRSVVFFIVLHGNLNDAIGWRSRDPRRRLFDYRSGLAAARHPRIRFVVLEDYILAAAVRERALRPETTSVWPNAINEGEFPTDPPPAWSGRERIRIAFAGTASRNKGFHRFLDLARAADPGVYEFELVGSLMEPFPGADQLIDIPSQPLQRDAFIQRLRAADYVVLPYNETTYEFTSSGSLVDCIGQMKPVIALGMPGILDVSKRFGEIGFVCSSMQEMHALLLRKDRLSDLASYTGFQRNLAAAAASRTAAGIAQLIRRDLATAGVPAYGHPVVTIGGQHAGGY
jgi:glycosyltransferase involved in cell wall biosynthesis